MHLKDTLFLSLTSFWMKRQKYAEQDIEFPQKNILTMNYIHIYNAICTFSDIEIFYPLLTVV